MHLESHLRQALHGAILPTMGQLQSIAPVLGQVVQRHGQIEGELQRTGEALETLRCAAAESSNASRADSDPQIVAERARAAGAEAARHVLGAEGAELSRQLQAATKGMPDHFEKLARGVVERAAAVAAQGGGLWAARAGARAATIRTTARAGMTRPTGGKVTLTRVA